MLCSGAPCTRLRAAPCKSAAQRDTAASCPAATAPSRRMRARHARVEMQSGGGGGEASAPLTLADLKTALRPISESLDELRSVTSATSENVAALRSLTSATSENVAALVEVAAAAAVASSE